MLVMTWLNKAVDPLPEKATRTACPECCRHAAFFSKAAPVACSGLMHMLICMSVTVSSLACTFRDPSSYDYRPSASL
jgi:hypothetical protein